MCATPTAHFLEYANIMKMLAVVVADVDHDRHIEFRIVFLNLFAPYFSRNFSNDETVLAPLAGAARNFASASRFHPNLGIAQYVLVPLRVGALHGRQVELFAFQDEPDGYRDRVPALPPSNHTDLDLAVPSEACLQMSFGVDTRCLR
jgi:hypothetical protein